jgi:predicted membrane protein
MFIAIIIFLLALWVIGYFGFHLLGWFIHALLIAAVVMFLWRVVRGKNPLK